MRKKFTPLFIEERHARKIKAAASLQGKKICDFMGDLAEDIDMRLAFNKNEKGKKKSFFEDFKI